MIYPETTTCKPAPHAVPYRMISRAVTLTHPLLVLTLVVVLVGCGARGAYDDTPSEREAVEAVLAIRWDTMTAAFADMTSGAYQENRLLDVWRPGDERAYLRSALVHEAGHVVRRTVLDSSGAFRSSWTERLVAPSSGMSIPFDHWLDNEPTYVSPRRRDEYRFETLPDTTLGGVAVRRHRVTARAADEGGLQAATFLIAGPDNQVVGLDETREEHAPFFNQASRLQVLLRESDSTWRPDAVVLDVTVDAPARDPQRYRVSRRFAAGS